MRKSSISGPLLGGAPSQTNRDAGFAMQVD
jgi:hypothetical protein